MNIGIIGAGITGLSAAYELSKKGHTVTIFERSEVPGGLGTYLPIGDTSLERYYHHFFESDLLIKEYAKEFGIDRKLKFYDAKSSIFIDGKIFPFNSATHLLNYTPLSVTDRLRCGVTTAFFKFLKTPYKKLDTISAVDWIKKYAGENVYQKIWGPLLEGKFSQFAHKVPALWLWGRIYDRSYTLGYFDGSVKILFDALIKNIESQNGTVYLNAEITGVEKKGKQITIYQNKKKHTFDKVIITTVSPIAEKLIKNTMSTKYRKKLQSIDHLGAVCLILELKKKVQSQYWVNLCEPHSPVLVMIEHTNFIPSSKYKGKHLIYLANYLHRSDPRFSLTDKEVYDTYTTVLKRMNKHFSKTWISKWHVSRVPRAQTIFQLHALKNIPAMQTEIYGIYLANIDQMYPHDRNLNQGIELGKKVAGMI